MLGFHCVLQNFGSTLCGIFKKTCQTTHNHMQPQKMQEFSLTANLINVLLIMRNACEKVCKHYEVLRKYSRIHTFLNYHELLAKYCKIL